MKSSKLILTAAALTLIAAFVGCKKDDKSNDYPPPAPVNYTISTAAGLDSVRYDLSGNYILMNDISLADYSAGKGWEPIGSTWKVSFTGRFDGNGHKITGLVINRPAEDFVGLFGYIDYNGSVTNLGVEIAAGGINGGGNVGGIAGSVYGGTITNCYSTGTISSAINSSAGGIVGYVVAGGTIAGCYSTGNVTSDNSSSSGGIAGSVVSGYIISCYSTGKISSAINSSAGGIAGYVSGSTIASCAAINPSINSAGFAGRIVGIISEDFGSSIMSNNFALDNMVATGDGKFVTTDIDSYGVSKTDAQLKTQSTYSNGADATGLGQGDTGLGWTFGNDDAHPWKMPAGGGYPVLYWQK